MAIVYLEELTKQVPNKYLAVNVIAKRARSLNDELLSAGFSKKEKPVSIATEELAAGELTYKKVEPDAVEPEAKPLFTSESNDYDAVDGDEHIAELFGESDAEEGDVDGDSDTEVTVVEEGDGDSDAEVSDADVDDES